jgi:hypothetical protein
LARAAGGPRGATVSIGGGAIRFRGACRTHPVGSGRAWLGYELSRHTVRPRLTCRRVRRRRERPTRAVRAGLIGGGRAGFAYILSRNARRPRRADRRAIRIVVPGAITTRNFGCGIASTIGSSFARFARWWCRGGSWCRLYGSRGAYVVRKALGLIVARCVRIIRTIRTNPVRRSRTGHDHVLPWRACSPCFARICVEFGRIRSGQAPPTTSIRNRRAVHNHIFARLAHGPRRA